MILCPEKINPVTPTHRSLLKQMSAYPAGAEWCSPLLKKNLRYLSTHPDFILDHFVVFAVAGEVSAYFFVKISANRRESVASASHHLLTEK